MGETCKSKWKSGALIAKTRELEKAVSIGKVIIFLAVENAEGS